MNRFIFIAGLSFLGILGCNKLQPEMLIYQPTSSEDDTNYYITKSENPGHDSLSQSNPTHKILRIYIDTPEQLQAIERDTSILIFHYCSPSDSEKHSPVHYSPSEKGYTYSNVPVSTLLNMSFGHTTFQSVYNELSTYIGQYFTASEFNTFTSLYSIFL